MGTAWLASHALGPRLGPCWKCSQYWKLILVEQQLIRRQCSRMADEFTHQDDRRALFMPLLGSSKSPAADAFIDGLFDRLIRPRLLGGQMRPTSLEKARRALAALMADLCRYRPQGRDGKHGMAPKDFPAQELGFGRTAFLLVSEALVKADAMRFKKGWNFTSEGFGGGPVRHGGSVAMFRLAPCMVERLGALCGTDAGKHWAHGRPKIRPDEPLLSLRSRKVGSEGGDELAYVPDELGVGAIVAGIERLTSFLDGRVDGFAYAGIRRVYNDGDMPGKRWRRGGRWFSRKGGEAYENMGMMMRVETISLGGEIICEVDISASHLAVLHGLLALPFDPRHSDPYACGMVHREAVKAFLTASFGRGTLDWKRWSRRSIDTYAEKAKGRMLDEDYTVDGVRSAILKRYPFLANFSDLETNSLDLQWHEAEILTLAMTSLMERNTPSLPVHDALLVPESKLEEAKAALRRAFATHFGDSQVVPALKVTYGGPNAVARNL